MVELLKQEQYVPMPLAHQVASLFTGVNGYLDDVPTARVKAFEKEFLAFLDKSYPDILHDLQAKKMIEPALEQKLKIAIEKFKTQWGLTPRGQTPSGVV